MVQGIGYKYPYQRYQALWVGRGLAFLPSFCELLLVRLKVLLPILLGGAKEPGIVYISIIRGAKEPRNLQC